MTVLKCQLGQSGSLESTGANLHNRQSVHRFPIGKQFMSLVARVHRLYDLRQTMPGPSADRVIHLPGSCIGALGCGLEESLALECFDFVKSSHRGRLHGRTTDQAQGEGLRCRTVIQ